MKARDKTRGCMCYPGGFVRLQPWTDLADRRWLAYRDESGRTSALCDDKGEVLYFAGPADAAAALKTAALSVSEYLRKKRSP